MVNADTEKAQASNALYDADKPSEKDLFGRRFFAERVADVITGRPLGEPLVVSIVGEWGSGKTTVMGFIKDKLAGLSSKPAEFNPWRYSGEDVMLFELFDALVKAIDPKLNVLTDWQRIKSAFGARIDAVKATLGAVGDLHTPGTGSLIQGAIGTVATNLRTEIEQVRLQAQKHLAGSDFRVTVLLDDIDRLEAHEILVLFRLIKLSCDLPNTTFVLAMDEDHVSEVIGQRIDGKQVTGRAYIEKIVNVRIALPTIPDYKLRGFTLSLLNLVLDQSRLPLADKEAARCVRIFDGLCTTMIKTPRRAKALANAYRFSLGLLPGQVNAGDLMLLEGVRLLRPELHKAILKIIPRVMRGESADDFTRVLRELEGSDDKPRQRSWNEILGSLGDISDAERDEASEALKLWFPQLDQNV